jgi:adenylate cyclase class 2
MNQEFETQVLDIDKEEIINKLRELGTTEEPEVLQKRWVFDIDPCTVESTGEWLRLRQVGDKKPTLTYKKKSGKGIDETEEIEFEVSDFEKAAALLSKIEFKDKVFQENKRMRFELAEIEFTLDTWPKIPTFLEIEAKSEERVHAGLKMLGLTDKDAGHVGHVAIYKKHGMDLHSFKDLRF